jgi:hypothetical protein
MVRVPLPLSVTEHDVPSSPGVPLAIVTGALSGQVTVLVPLPLSVTEHDAPAGPEGPVHAAVASDAATRIRSPQLFRAR